MEKIRWRRDRLPIPLSLGFPCGSAGKGSACNAGGLGLIPGLGRSPREGNGYPLQYSGRENSMDCIVHRVPKSWTQLSYFHHKYQNISLVYIPSAFEDVVYLFHMFQMPTVIFSLTNAKFETCPANPCLVSSFLHDQILIKGRESGKAENVWSLREGRGSDLWIASQGLLFSFHSHSTS